MKRYRPGTCGPSHGEAMFPPRLRHGAGGHCLKAGDERYKSGACKSWLKVKNPAYERRMGA
jgi:hypothetical protein